jgi:uncharacterized membrane protein
MSQTSPSPQPFLERLSDGLQQLIQVVIGSHRKPPRRLRSLLNGTWFGHPLHPVITDVPITAWMLTALFDIIWLVSPTHNSWAADGAFVAVIVGLLGALGAIVTGFTDWSDTYGSERRVGLNHSLFNVSATILYLISFLLRLLAGPGDGLLPPFLASWGWSVCSMPGIWVARWSSPKAPASTIPPGRLGARTTKRSSRSSRSRNRNCIV